MNGEAITAAEIALRADLQSTKIQLGVESGRWRIVRLDFPELYVAFSARAIEGSPQEYLVQFDCRPYPAAVRGVFWDDKRNTVLAPAEWPRLVGDQAFRSDYAPAGRLALYVACDGDTQKSKPQWATEHALQWWGPSSDISLYFEVINVRLHANRYCGNRGA